MLALAPMPRPWVTPKDAAERVGVTLDWFYRLLGRGEYDAERVSSGGDWRVFVDALGWPIRRR
jgi:excisionase family DNA binding protein